MGELSFKGLLQLNKLQKSFLNYLLEMSSNMRYYKDKAYFKTVIDDRPVMARTACIILKYVDNGAKKVLTIRERIDKDLIEFPGGKVEDEDQDIYDTIFREIWEEIILKGALGPNNGKYLRNWSQIRANIMQSKGYDQIFCTQLFHTLKTAKALSYGGNAFRTVYFIVDINYTQAQYLIYVHGMIPVPVEILSHIVVHNNRNRGTRKYYKGKDTYIHLQNEGLFELYKLRGRDFEGMFRYIEHL
jgi:hypothetical protein